MELFDVKLYAEGGMCLKAIVIKGGKIVEKFAENLCKGEKLIVYGG